jgi:hypothetical protein
MKKFKQYKAAGSDSEIISPPVMASKVNKPSRGPAGAVTHSEQADPPGKPPAPDTKAPMQKLKKDQLNPLEAKKVSEAVESLPPEYHLSDHSPEIDEMNHHFDEVLENKKFANPFLIIHAIRSILEKYSITLPMVDMDGIDDEFVFKIEHPETEGYHLYITIDTDPRGHYEGYAQVVDKKELASLEKMDDDMGYDIDDSLLDNQLVSRYLMKTRHTADD